MGEKSTDPDDCVEVLSTGVGAGLLLALGGFSDFGIFTYGC